MPLTGDRVLADEATQAAWLIAWKKLGKVYGEDHLRPWLVSVAANEAKKLMSKRRRRAEFETIFESTGEPGGIDPATGVAGIDLDAAMSRLDPDDPVGPSTRGRGRPSRSRGWCRRGDSTSHPVARTRS